MIKIINPFLFTLILLVGCFEKDSRNTSQPHNQHIVNNFINACIISEIFEYMPQAKYIKLEASYVQTKVLLGKIAEVMNKTLTTCNIQTN